MAKQKEKTVYEELDDYLSDQNAAAELVHKIISGRLLYDQSRHVYYRVTDPRTQECAPIPHVQVSDAIARIIDKGLRDWAHEQHKIDYTAPAKALSTMCGIARRRCELVTDVAGCRPRWEPGYCLHRCMIEPDPSVETPLFDGFFDRHSDGKFLMAWYWGIYSGEYNGRQNPYTDSDGETGRTTSQTVIHDALFGRGKGYGSINIKPQAIDSRFVYEAVAGKKLLFVGECKNPAWVLSSVYNEISGGDTVSIEGKGKAAYTDRVKAGIMTLANNMPPKLRNERAVLSRTVPMNVQPFADGGLVGDVESKLQAELPGLLWKMQEAWHELSENDGYYIRTNEAVDQLVSELVDDEDSVWQSFIDLWFEPAPEGVVSGAELQRAFDDHFRSKRVYRDFTGWLDKQSRYLKYRSNGVRYAGLRFRPTKVALGDYRNEQDSPKRGRMIRARIEQMEGS